jgi:hypothetical protein
MTKVEDRHRAEAATLVSLQNSIVRQRAIATALAKAEARGAREEREACAEPFEMRLCEQEHVVLKPNQAYRFTVDPNCERCRILKKMCSPAAAIRSREAKA